MGPSLHSIFFQGGFDSLFSGQTGSGKTFTMQGPTNEDGSIDYSQRGLIPRTFDYLFDAIHSEERKGNGVSYYCKCSYVELYNEAIYDLLDPHGQVCTLREDAKKGVFIEGCREEVIYAAQDALMIFEQGFRNRHVAETSMNRESSRSHSVFTIFLQSKKLDGEVLDVREARFNLVDLAGSERQQFSNTAGARLKEAGNINKSLLALSNVINALVDIANGKPRHVHYRDSKLTFLLRDSLGGNSKTLIIATVSPSPLCQAETLSTLRFAQRAKQIKNKAIVNKDIQGNMLELQAEVRRLRNELLLLQTAQGAPVTIPIVEPLNQQGNVYFMLSVALDRQAELISEMGMQKQRVNMLEELLKRREQQSEKMVTKFREGTIKSLQAKLMEQNPADLFDVFNAERSQYKQEITELRKQLESHPEVSKFAYENFKLCDELKKYQSFVDEYKHHQEQLDRLRKYIEALHNEHDLTKDQVVSLKTLLDQQKRQSIASDEIPTQDVDTACKSISDTNETLRHSFEKLVIEKNDLEARYLELVRSREGLTAHVIGVECERGEDEYFDEAHSMKRRKIIRSLEEQFGSLEELLTMQKDLIRQVQHLQQENFTLQSRERELSIVKIQLSEVINDKIRLKDELENLQVAFTELKADLCQSTISITKLQEELLELRVKLKDWAVPLEMFGSNAEDVVKYISEEDRRQTTLRQQLNKLEFQLHSTQHDNEDLLAQIRILEESSDREKLKEAHDSISNLTRDLDSLQEEVLKLTRENDKLIQHSNVRQKLQYHVQIKEENNQFRHEIKNLREELTKLSQRNLELEELLHTGRHYYIEHKSDK